MKTEKRVGIQKVLRIVVAVGVLLGLIVVATATEKNEIYASYDKNSYSEEHKEVVLPVPKGREKAEILLKGIRTYVYNDEGARFEEDGELVTVELTEEKAYIIREVAEEEASKASDILEEIEKESAYEIVLLREYLNKLYEGEYIFLVDFVDSQEEEEEGTEEVIIKTEEYIVEIKNSVLVEEEVALVSSPITLVSDQIQPFGVGDAYNIEIESTTMAENATTFRFSIAEGTGTLRIAIDLQGSGEIDRYILIKLPAYGMVLSGTLPSVEAGMTAVTKIDDRTLRLDIADAATQILNIDIAYVRAYMTRTMEQAWRNGIVPPYTGFKVEVYGKPESETNELLSEQAYGNWFVDLSGTLDVGSMSQTVPTGYVGATSGVTHANNNGSLVSTTTYNLTWNARVAGIDENINMQPQYLRMLKWYIPQEVYDASNVNKVTYPLKEDEKGKYIELLLGNAAIRSVLCGENTNMTWNYRIVQLMATGIRENWIADTTYPVKMEMVYGVYTETGIVDKSVMHDMGGFRTAKDVEVDTWRVGTSYTINAVNGGRAFDDRGVTMFRSAYDESNQYKVVKGRRDTLYLADYGNVAYLSGDTSYNPEDRYEGLTVTYDFPYELQPTEFLNGFAKWTDLGDILEFRYRLLITYSDGETMMLEEAVNTSINTTITLPQRAGRYITSVSVIWDEFWQNGGYRAYTGNSGNGYQIMGQTVNTASPYFIVNIMDKDKDGNNIPSGTKVHIDVTMTKGNGTQIAKAREDQLCFFLYDEAMGCPGLTQSQISGYVNRQWQVRAYEQKQEIGYIARTSFATGYSLMRDTIRDPKLIIGMRPPSDYISSFYPVVVDNLERVGYFMTGKMRVYPMLAGWTVNYATYNTLGITTQRTMTLPDTIPVEGYELQLMIPAGERLASSTYVDATHYDGIIISKAGNVSGWTTGIDIVSHIELQSPRQKDDGSSFESVGNEGRNYSMGRVFAALTNTDCNCQAHTAAGLNHNHPSLADALTGTRGYGYGVENGVFGNWNGERFYNYLIGFQSIFSMTRGATLTPSAPGYDVYQNDSVTVSVGGYKSIIGSERGSNASYMAPFFKTQTQLYDIINWEKAFQPTMYVKIINDDFMVAEGATTIRFTLSRGEIEQITPARGTLIPTNFSVPAEVEVILDESWQRWIKVTALDGVELPIGFMWNQANILITAEIEVYAIPGAVVGTARPFFEKWYLEDELVSWGEIYAGSEEANYGSMIVNDMVADVLDITGKGDRTILKLYEYAGYPINVYTKVFSGVGIYPGVGNSFAIANRHQEFYPDARNEINTLVTITTDNSILEDYAAVFELPRKDKSITGFFYNTLDGIQAVTSEVDIFLRGPVTERSNSSGASMEVMYRIGTQWYTQAQVEGNGGWEAVTAYRITTNELIAQSSVNFNVPLAAKEKTTLDDLDAYMGGTIDYKIAGMPTSVNMIMGQYSYKPYTIGGVVWNDVNEDGTRVAADLPLSGYKVDLKRASDNSVVATSITEADGRYTMITNEFADLYLEITIPSGKKLTYQRTIYPLAYADDSDFDRSTNRSEIGILTGSITVDAGIIILPVITMPDYIVQLGDTVNITGIRTGGYTPTISYAPADNTIASITDTTGILTISMPTAVVAGLKLGETIVTMTVTNSLGDTEVTTFKVTVIEEVKEVEIDLTKQLEAVASEVGVFVFRIEKLSDSNAVEQTFYQTIKIPAGATDATIRIGKLQAGRYRITEVENNWRYSIVGMIGQTIEVTDPKVAGEVTFINRLDNTSWSSGKADMTNTMKREE